MIARYYCKWCGASEIEARRDGCMAQVAMTVATACPMVPRWHESVRLWFRWQWREIRVSLKWKP